MAAVLLCLLTLACGMRTSCGASAVKSTSSPNVTRSWFWTSSPHTPSDLTGSMASMMSGGVFTLRAASYAGLSGVTICLRVIADTTPRPTFFSLSVGPQAIARLEAGEGGRYLLTVGEASRSMAMAALMPAFGKLWPWTGVCVTWDSASGMAQMWLDGRLSVRQAMWRGQSFYGKAALTERHAGSGDRRPRVELRPPRLRPALLQPGVGLPVRRCPQLEPRPVLQQRLRGPGTGLQQPIRAGGRWQKVLRVT